MPELSDRFPEVDSEKRLWTKTLAIRTWSLDTEKAATVLEKNLIRNISAANSEDELIDASYDILDTFLKPRFVPDLETREELATAFVKALKENGLYQNINRKVIWMPAMLDDAGHTEQALSMRPDRLCRDTRKMAWTITAATHSGSSTHRLGKLNKQFSIALEEELSQSQARFAEAEQRLARDEYGYDEAGKTIDRALLEWAKGDSDGVSMKAHRALDVVPQLMGAGFMGAAKAFLAKAEDSLDKLSPAARNNLIVRISRTLHEGVEAYTNAFGELPEKENR
jgi:hypothetical protein